MSQKFAVWLNKVKKIVAKDLIAVDQIILNCLETAIIAKIDHNVYLKLQALIKHGKRFRSVLVLLAAKSIFFKETIISPRYYQILAAVIELIHVASLLHDDVLDNAVNRRNQISINAKFGNKFAILAGDLLYIQVFKLIAQLQLNLTQLDQLILLVTSTVNSMIQGEILQLINQGYSDHLEKQYWQIISAKTAKLFELSMKLPSLLIVKPKLSDQKLQSALQVFGFNLGMAYQLLDDLIDYQQQHEDLKQGKLTLPIIYVLNNLKITKKTKTLCLKIIARQYYNNSNKIKTTNDLQLLNAIITEYGGFAYTHECIVKYLAQAKDAIIKINSNKVNTKYTGLLKDLISSFM